MSIWPSSLKSSALLGDLLRSHRGQLPFIAALGLLATILEGIGIGLLIPLAAMLLSGTIPAGLPGPIETISQGFLAWEGGTRIAVLGAILLVLIVAKGLVQAANTILISHIETRIAKDLRDTLSARILGLEYPFFLKNEASRLVTIVSGDSWAVSHAARAALQIIPAVIGLTVFALFLLWLDWRLFLIVLAGGLLIQLALRYVEKWQRRLSSATTDSYTMLSERMLAIISATRAIRVFGQEAREQARFASASEDVRGGIFSIRRLAAFVTPSVEILAAILFIAILLAGYALSVSLPEITAFLIILLRLQPHAQMISQSRMGIASESKAIAEVEWLLAQSDTDGGNAAEALPVSSLDTPIVFDRVSYSYPDGSAALHDVTLSIEPGVATALIGKSGSGKTTLVNLLCRLLLPETGVIRLGDQSVDTLDLAQWRGRIAIAGQDIDLVSGTVADNIAYGCPQASERDVRGAAEAAGAHAFITDLAQGYQTPVGREGMSLSGGQRQRIALARALVKQPDLLVLDEATNSVDAMTEAEIMTLLAEHRHFRTALVISHRQQTLSACQNGIVLDAGRIVEAGPLAELAYYRKMAAGSP